MIEQTPNDPAQKGAFLIYNLEDKTEKSERKSEKA